jgi:hypothetical protein
VTTWRVSTATPQMGMFWLGTVDKPELIGVSILPCDETNRAHARAQAMADALTAFDEATTEPRRRLLPRLPAIKGWSP